MAKTRKQLDSIEQARRHLGQVETIEGLLEFDLPSLILYADDVAEVRQKLVRSINSPPD